MKVFLLSHERKLEDGAKETKIIGIYSSINVADMTIDKYKNITGFKDYPNDFVIKEYEVIGTDNQEIFPGNTVYFLQHEYSIDENGTIYDYITDIDMFINYDDAKNIMDELKQDPMYADKTKGVYSDNCGFCIDEIILDENYWTEGFVDWELQVTGNLEK